MTTKTGISDIAELARRQLADYDRHRPGAIFEDGAMELTVVEAYQLQIEVARLRHERGETIAGYKIGCVSQTMQAQLLLDRPVFGHVFESELHRCGARLTPELYDGLAIEGEFAVRLARDIPSVEWLREHPGEAVARCFAVIELHNYVFRNSPHTAQELIGNNAIHAGVVLPRDEGSVTDMEWLLDEPISVFLNGRLVGSSSGRALPGGPFASLLRLAEHLETFGRKIRQGQVVLTGSPLPLYRVSAGDWIEVKCQNLDSVSATVRSPLSGAVTTEELFDDR